jgi:hypothetical protein
MRHGTRFDDPAGSAHSRGLICMRESGLFLLAVALCCTAEARTVSQVLLENRY